MNIFVDLPKQKVTVFLFVVVLVLTTISFLIGLVVSEQITDSSFVKQLLTLFNLDGEGNIPTWFTTLLLSFNGLLMLSIGNRRKLNNLDSAFYWIFLGLVFLLLSIDEFVKLHEVTIRPLRDTLGTSGGLYYAWVIPAGIFVVLLGLFYLPFLFKLPAQIRNLIVLAGIIYVAGAVGMEVLGGEYIDNLISTQGDDTVRGLGYVILVNIEETLEMLGLVILYYALMSYINTYLEPES